MTKPIYMNFLTKLFGYGLMANGWFWGVFISAVALFKGEGDLKGAVISFLFGAASFGLGRWLNKRTDARSKKDKDNRLEIAILQIAKNNEGKTTPVEVSTQLHIPLERAQEKLDDMQLKGAMEIQVTETGGFLYSLNNYVPIDKK